MSIEASPAAAAPEESASDSAGPALDPPAPTGPVKHAGKGVAGRLLLVLAVCAALVSLLLPISRSGIWDPPELANAELARRIALNQMNAPSLSLEGANNQVPTLGELSRGELPFTSMAIGFKLFGLHDWAGRLPLALWALLGALALYWLVSRLSDAKSGALSVIVLSTTPLYFLHARTMLGEAVTLSALALSTAGLALAVFDRRSSADGVAADFAWSRAGWLLLGALGLAAGFGARGAWVGVAVPCLAVGLAWWLSLGARRSVSAFGGAVAVACLGLGVVAAWIGYRAMLQADPAHYSIWLGAGVDQARQRPTFDLLIEQLGHGLLPWSAVLPIAIGRLFMAPKPSASSGQGVGEQLSQTDHAVIPTAAALADERVIGLRLVLILVASLSLLAHTLLAPTTGELVYSAVFALAAMVGLLLRDAERNFSGSLAAGVVVVALAVVFYTDYKNFPEKGLTAFAVSGAKFPESFQADATRYIKYGALLAAAAFAFLFMEKRPAGQGFQRAQYRAYLETLRTAFDGNLRFFVLLLWAAAVGFGALSVGSRRFFRWDRIETMSSTVRDVAGYAWLLIPLLVLAPLAVMVLRDAAGVLFRRLPVGRFTVAGLAVASFGLVLSFGYYPALAAQISPKQVFEAYARLAQPGQPLAMVGQNSGSASYYAGGQVLTHPNVNAAVRWLDDPSERRWLVMRASDLPQVNSKHRERHKTNLPVLDARSSEILLVSNRLEQTERNQNPFKDWFLDAPRAPMVEVGADLDQLVNLGWEITDATGKPVETEVVDGKAWPVVRPGVEYKFAIHWRVVKSLSGNWKTFIHIDGYRRRYNGDHDTLEGKYPIHLWRPQDQVVDIHPVRLEPHFTPGRYEVLYGLYIGERRLDVRKGNHDKNRIKAGLLVVR